MKRERMKREQVRSNDISKSYAVQTEKATVGHKSKLVKSDY